MEWYTHTTSIYWYKLPFFIHRNPIQICSNAYSVLFCTVCQQRIYQKIHQNSRNSHITRPVLLIWKCRMYDPDTCNPNQCNANVLNWNFKNHDFVNLGSLSTSMSNSKIFRMHVSVFCACRHVFSFILKWWQKNK